jgi:quinol monooxygenase YgiN
MRLLQCVISIAAIGIGMPIAHAQAPAPGPAPDPNAPVYVVGFIDILPPSKNAAISLLKKFSDACRKEDGNLRCELVQRLERPNQLALLEVWKDQKAFEAHGAAAGTVQLLDKLKPMFNSPYDQRVHTDFAVQRPAPPPSGRIVYLITHVDVIPIPKFMDDATAALQQLADAGRRDAGVGRLEVLQEIAPRLNHFIILEIWTNRKVLEAHQMGAGYLQFRDKVQPTIGSLYDERLYKIPD